MSSKDPNFKPVDMKVIHELMEKIKTEGLFDQLRRICLAQVDSAPGYQNLTYRVGSHVTRLLSKERWHPRMSKQILRERIRTNLDQTAILQKGIQYMVDGLIESKTYELIRPKMITAFCNILQLSDRESYLLSQKLNGTFKPDEVLDDLPPEFEPSDTPVDTKSSFLGVIHPTRPPLVDTGIQPQPSFSQRGFGPPVRRPATPPLAPRPRFSPHPPQRRPHTPVAQGFGPIGALPAGYRATGFPPDAGKTNNDEQESITVEMEDASREGTGNVATRTPPPVSGNMQQSFKQLAQEFSTFAQSPQSSGKNPVEMYSKLEKVFQQLVDTAGPGSTGDLLKKYFSTMASPEKRTQLKQTYLENRESSQGNEGASTSQPQDEPGRPRGVSKVFESMRKQSPELDEKKESSEHKLDYDDLSDITVSSVHTSDLSNLSDFSDPDKKKGDKDAKSQKVIKAKRLKSKAKLDSRRKNIESKRRSRSPKPIVVSKTPRSERKRTPMSADEDWEAERKIFKRFANRRRRRSRSPPRKPTSPSPPRRQQRARSRNRHKPYTPPPSRKRGRPRLSRTPPAKPSTPPGPKPPTTPPGRPTTPPLPASKKQPYSPLSSDEESLSKMKEEIQREIKKEAAKVTVQKSHSSWAIVLVSLCGTHVRL